MSFNYFIAEKRAVFYSLIKKSIFIFVLFCSQLSICQNISDDPIILAYFPSWSESFANTGQDSKLRRIPSFVNFVFLAFAKPDLTYEKGSFDLKGTGVQVPYDGCTLKESVSALKDKGIEVILSVGGETYWTSNTIYENINYQQIKDFVDDMGFVGIDWDFEPNGSFSGIGTPENVQHFIDFFNKSRAIMPKSEGYILACAPSGVGALGGQTNDDANSPFSFAKRNTLTGEDDTNLYKGEAQTNGINLFGFSASGHMIPVIESVGDKIDIIAYQGYNAGGSLNRSIMYDAYAYYAEKYDFKVVAGVHYPNEPWGPFYEYTHENVASLSNHIAIHKDRAGKKDGIMIWQLLMEGNNSSAYSYLNVASKVLNGTDEATAISQANNFSLSPYTGGAQGCGPIINKYCGVSEYVNSNTYPGNTEVYYSCKIWKNKWFANIDEIPGQNNVWEEIKDCMEGEGCDSLGIHDELLQEGIIIYSAENILHIQNKSTANIIENVKIHDLSGKQIRSLGQLSDKNTSIILNELSDGVYILRLHLSNHKTLSLKIAFSK